MRCECGGCYCVEMKREQEMELSEGIYDEVTASKWIYRTQQISRYTINN